MCNTPLPKRTLAKSAPASRPETPDQDDQADNIIKISFRRGGDKLFYETLKNAMSAKVWDAIPPPIRQPMARSGIRTLILLLTCPS